MQLLAYVLILSQRELVVLIIILYRFPSFYYNYKYYILIKHVDSIYFEIEKGLTHVGRKVLKPVLLKAI